MYSLQKIRNLSWWTSNSNFLFTGKKSRCIERHFFHNLAARSFYKISSLSHTFCACDMQFPKAVKIHHGIYLVQIRDYAKKSGSKNQKGKHNVHKILLTDEELGEVFDVTEYHNELKKVINNLKSSFIEHLSIYASSGSIDMLPIKIEGEEYPLNELANIGRKNVNLISIDMSGFPEGLKPAIQAINESGIGINPQQEGTMIYLPIPKVTRDHREKLVKNAKALFNKAKEEIRVVQNHYVKEVKKQTDLSEDLIFSSQQQIMIIAEQYAAEAEKLLKMKQNELLPN